jgi:hypothetical protein
MLIPFMAVKKIGFPAPIFTQPNINQHLVLKISAPSSFLN